VYVKTLVTNSTAPTVSDAPRRPVTMNVISIVIVVEYSR
jgi:hypothetical protein